MEKLIAESRLKFVNLIFNSSMILNPLACNVLYHENFTKT